MERQNDEEIDWIKLRQGVRVKFKAFWAFFFFFFLFNLFKALSVREGLYPSERARDFK